MNISMMTAGALGLLLLFLSANVIAGRAKFKINIGDGGNELLHQRIRTQANFVEYVPIALILIMLIEYGQIGPGWLLRALATALVGARLLHAQGLLASTGTSAGRFIGTTLTALVILVAALTAIGRGLGLW